MMTVVLLFAVLLAVGVGILQKRGLFLAQYLFFLRYPVLFAFALTLGPVFAVTAGGDLFGNFFSLHAGGVVFTMALAYFASSTVVYAFNIVFSGTPGRTGLALFRLDRDPGRRPLEQHADLADKIAPWHFRLTALLLVPLGFVLIIKSEPSWYWAAVLVVFGAAAGALVAFLGSQFVVGALSAWLASPVSFLRSVGERRGRRGAAVRYVLELFEDGFEGPTDPSQRLHYRAFVFCALSVCLYVLGFFLLRASFASPERQLASAVPPVAYVLVLMMIWTWVFSFLAYFFDKYRIPVGLIIATAWTFSYTYAAKDHYFELVKPATAAVVPVERAASCALSPAESVRAWHQRRSTSGKRPTLVIVAASGGGITASAWTATVLAGVSARTGGLGPEFAESILLVSSASGGGVGASYFVDSYRKGHAPGGDRAELDRIVEAAGASSLHDTAFALAYSDLLRLAAPFLVDPTSPDRGRALEGSWARWMSKPTLTLSDWREGVRGGWRPTQIFNVTISETGERLLLAPIDCPTAACAGRWRGKSALDLYGPSDMPVVTAARLSATFPWVTPLARAPDDLEGYHLGDGGYYDNFGIVTAIEWLFSVQAEIDHDRPASERKGLKEFVEKVLLVQVRASQPTEKKPSQDQGWLYAAAGPLLTLLNVSPTSQRNHNEAHLVGMKALLASQGVSVETVTFELGEEMPLSWHLTTQEKKVIADYWSGNADILKERARLSCLWSNPSSSWTQECEAKAPIVLTSPSAGAQIFKEAEEQAASLPSPSIEPSAADPMPVAMPAASSSEPAAAPAGSSPAATPAAPARPAARPVHAR